MQNPSKLLPFTQRYLERATEHMPPYSSRFSKHTLTQPQRIVLDCLKLKLGMIPKIVWVIGLLAGIFLVSSLPQSQSQTAGQSAPPFPMFPVTESNSRRTEPVSLYDFVPFSVTLERLPNGRIVIDRSQGWTASNFVPFGMCWDDENTLIFHSSVNIGGSHFHLMLGGERFYRFLTGPSNPTGNPVLNVIAYDEGTRTWYHKILDLRSDPPVELLYVEGRGRLAPLWIGKPEGPFVVHGIAGVQDEWLLLDTWGGYLDFEELLACRFHDPRTGQSYDFQEGFTFMDREYHRNLPLGPITIRGGEVIDGVEFDCMSFHQAEGEEIEFLFCLALNPLPAEIKQKFEFPPFEHFGRLAFPDRGESYLFDDYQFRTDGQLQPQTYYLQGWFVDPQGHIVGSVDLRAEAFWGRGGTEAWQVQRPWWDPEGRTAWGRSFVRWRGTITLGDEIIEVEGVPGFGEFMRYKPGREP